MGHARIQAFRKDEDGGKITQEESSESAKTPERHRLIQQPEEKLSAKRWALDTLMVKVLYRDLTNLELQKKNLLKPLRRFK